MTENLLTDDMKVDTFGLRGFDFSVRIPERSEMFTREEALLYIEGCDYPASVDDFLLALEIENLFGTEKLQNMTIVDAMAGPGRLGRELVALQAGHVINHDGSDVMIAHAKKMTRSLNGRLTVLQSPVESIPLDDNTADLVICHNSTHQLVDQGKLKKVLEEFLRITIPGGHVIIADYQRGSSQQFLEALEQRLMWTKPEIVPLLVPTFQAAFSVEEFSEVIQSMSDIARWTVRDGQPPQGLSDNVILRIEADPVKGHLLDFSPISLRAIIQKEEI